MHSYRQPSLYFPTPGGTFAGESLPGEMTWARAYISEGVLWMDIGRGEVVKLPREVRDAWWEGTTREWPFMAADMGVSRDALMAHYLSNHVAVAYGDVFDEMVALSQELGLSRAGPELNQWETDWQIASTSASTSARAARAPRSSTPRASALGMGTHPIQIFRPPGGLRRAVVGGHLGARAAMPCARRSRLRICRPSGSRASASTRPARWWRSGGAIAPSA